LSNLVYCQTTSLVEVARMKRSPTYVIFSLAFLLSLCFTNSGRYVALAEEDYADPPGSAFELEENSSFIWFEDKEVFSDSKRVDEIVKVLRDNGLMDIERYHNALLVGLGTVEAQKFIEEKKLNGLLGKVKIEPNAVIYTFASQCDEGPGDYNTEQDPWGILRVWGSKPPNYTGTAAAWIIDSGVADYDGVELNVKSRRNCLLSNCPTDTAKIKDKIGHGTMIAGIIGAISNSEGVYGMAPNAPIHALRITKGRQPETNFGFLKKAVDWLNSQSPTTDADPMTLSPGDVINISVGGRWNPLATSTERDIETTLHELADKGLRVVVAAGNRDTLGGLSYVQAISPARAGGYRSATTVNSIKGVVWTASAIKPSTDEFWDFSAFGNFTRTALNTDGDGPPDFAEPGKDIVSLWPGKDVAMCSGTSFAAAHLSGLLLTQEPRKLTRSNKDPSAEIPGFQNPKQYDTTRNDWIGVK
jgi:subtilisin family serine protease